MKFPSPGRSCDRQKKRIGCSSCLFRLRLYLVRCAPSMKRSASNDMEELRAMLQNVMKTVSTLEHRLPEQERCRPVCNFNALQKLMPTGPRDNGEFIYVCTECGRTQ